MRSLNPMSSAQSSLITLVVMAGVTFLRGADLPCASAESLDNLMNTWTRDFTAEHPGTPAHVTIRAR
ncbi:MAG: Phosphate transport system substrate-binding protein, partial [Verrucomicrobia bacterium]|nr:Phosphate transport system substrate-binding protein [Verrucomicrobiota bacterium]